MAGGKFNSCFQYLSHKDRRHIATGLSMYYNLTWGVWLRYCLKGMQDDVELIWPSLFTSMPLIVRKKASSSGQNGVKVH